MTKSIAVIGAGSWGTTLAALLADRANSVCLWCREPEVADGIRRTRRNPYFVSFRALPETLTATCDLEETISGADLCILAIPSRFLIQTISPAKDFLRKCPGIINVAKGLAGADGKSLSKAILEVLGVEPGSPDDHVAVLSGPNLAEEIAHGAISASVLASPHAELTIPWQDLLATPHFRVYRHTDRTGVELGGTLKNIFAIGAGIVDGLSLGDNAKAAYLTRGLHEMVRLGMSLGGRQQTFYGLSGLGDLMATANSPLSRNHRLGQALANGSTLRAFTSETRMVVEGVETARLAAEWGKRLTIPLPITEELCRVLFAEKSPKEAATQLMRRSLKDEED